MAEKRQSPRAEESFEKNLKPRFRWDKEEMINNFIQCEGKDFNTDNVKLYEYVKQKWQRFMYI